MRQRKDGGKEERTVVYSFDSYASSSVALRLDATPGEADGLREAASSDQIQISLCAMTYARARTRCGELVEAGEARDRPIRGLSFGILVKNQTF